MNITINAPTISIIGATGEAKVKRLTTSESSNPNTEKITVRHVCDKDDKNRIIVIVIIFSYFRMAKF